MVPLQIWVKNMETKTQIRKSILALRDKTAPEERNALSDIITQRLFTKEIYRRARKILLFASYRSEVDTWEIFRQAIQDTKQVYYPLCKESDMSFYRVFGEGDLSEGYKGIMEPKEEADRLFTAFEDETVLMVMPGAAFDMQCNRIGYGGGFYDRFLARGFRGTTLAVGFDFQLLRDAVILAEDTDQKPDYILTDKVMIACPRE